MARDVDITVGADTSAAQAGLADLRNFGEKAAGDLRSSFTRAFAVGTIVAGLVSATRALINYGDKIYDLGQRFGVSTTLLQQFGNAAEQNGSSMEEMALAFTKVILAQSKVNAGNTETIAHLTRLGISAKDFAAADPGKAMLMLGGSSKNAADMVGILGRNALAVIPTISGMADGSIALGRAMSEDAVKGLSDVSDGLKKLKEVAAAEAGPAVVMIFKAMSSGVVSFAALMKATATSAVADFKVIAAAMKFDWAGVEKALNEGKVELKKVTEKWDADMTAIFGKNGAPKRAVTTGGGGADPSDATSGAGGGAAGGSTGGGGASTSAESLQASIDRLREQSAAKQRTHAQQLNALMEERGHLQDALNFAQDGYERGLMSETDLLEAQKALEENNLELVTVKGTIEKENASVHEQEAKEREKAAEQAEREVAAAKENLAVEQERLLEMRLIAEGRGEEAEKARITFEWDTKIKEAIEAATAARAAGNIEAAKLNEALAKTLEMEKAIALEKQAAAAKAANTKVWHEGMQKFAQNASTWDPASLAQAGVGNQLNAILAGLPNAYADGRNPTFYEQIRLDSIARMNPSQFAAQMMLYQNNPQIIELLKTIAGNTKDPIG